MKSTLDINEAISELPDDRKQLISDGYHTFAELYEHRNLLTATMLNLLNKIVVRHSWKPWYSRLHSDGTSYEGYFIAGVTLPVGKMITYHLPNAYLTYFKEIMYYEKAPEWDGHTPEDVCDRLDDFLAEGGFSNNGIVSLCDTIHYVKEHEQKSFEEMVTTQHPEVVQLTNGEVDKMVTYMINMDEDHIFVDATVAEQELKKFTRF